MTVLLSLLGLLAVPVLTLGTAVAVASEFSLTALERSRIESAVARTDDRRTRAVRDAHATLTIDAEGTVSDLPALTRRSRFSRFPVVDGDPDVPLGLVHVKQAFSAPPAQRSSTRARDLARPVETVPSSLDGDLLMTRLRAAGLQTAVVVDEYGGTAGPVTMEDLVEEIVGDVRDEHDRAEQGRVRRLGDDAWALSGLLRPDEVLAATGFRMPAGGFETLAGLVVGELGRIPGSRSVPHRGG